MSRYKLKKLLRNNDIIFGGWISYDHPSIAETFALTGFDFISIDMEHAPISLASAQRIISITQSKGIPCLPRPVSHSNDIFKPLLDSGADGSHLTLEKSSLKNYFFFLWRFARLLFLRLCVATLCLFLFLPLGILKRFL